MEKTSETLYKLRTNGLQEFYKKQAISRHLAEIKNLVVGSSHAYYGFNAEKGDFNLGMTGQDLYYSCMLYHKYADIPQLKNIILFYDVFSPGYELQVGIDSFRSYLYKTFFGIPYKLPVSWKSKLYEIFLKIFILQKRPVCSQDYLGNCSYDWFFPAEADVKTRVEKHLKHNRRENRQTDFVKQMAEIAALKKHSFSVVIPPLRSDYRSFLPVFEKMFKDLLSLIPPPPPPRNINKYPSSKLPL